MTDFLKLSADAYSASTSYIDANYRKQWDANIRAFQSKHPVGSKYLSDAYKHRSRGFRPKTRSIIRKNEAAGASALFSNMDVVSIDAVDADNPMAAAGAAVNKEILQHRLTKTIPWFKLCMASLQDAQTMGVVCSYQYWKYSTRKKRVEIPGIDGEPSYAEFPETVEDEPCIELRPIENIRISPASDWLDPVKSSPYLIDIFPMTVLEVRKMAREQDKTGEPKWYSVTDEELTAASTEPDSTRNQRENNRQDRMEEPAPVGDYEIVWVHRNFMRTADGEYVYYTLGTQKLLSKPKKIEEVYPHLNGNRPYVMGICVVESHRPLPSGVADLSAPLQAEANEIANERRDNVKLVLNKKHIVARGKQVDIDALVRNVPGGVVLANDVNMDVKEMSYPDVTTSAYAEQDRINVDLDELVGNFSGGSVQTNRALNETVGGMKLLNQGASMMTEYLLRTWIETWLEPVLRQVMILEKEYESDMTILAIAGKKAQLFQKFGISQVTDQLLEQDLTLIINVGMGATNPDDRLRKFLAATESAIKLTTEAPPGADVKEMVKQVYAFAGFRDGERFFPSQENPQLTQALNMVKQLKAQLDSKQSEIQAANQVKVLQIQSDEKIKSAELGVDERRIQGDLQIRAAELAVDREKLELEKLKIQMEMHGASLDIQMRATEMQADIDAAQMKLEQERQKMIGLAVKIAGEAEKSQLELQHMQAEHQVTQQASANESKIASVADSVVGAMDRVRQEIQDIKGGLDNAHGAISAQSNLMGTLLNKKERRPKGYALKKNGPKTTAVVVNYDDGTREELPVL